MSTPTTSPKAPTQAAPADVGSTSFSNIPDAVPLQAQPRARSHSPRRPICSLSPSQGPVPIGDPHLQARAEAFAEAVMANVILPSVKSNPPHAPATLLMHILVGLEPHPGPPLTSRGFPKAPPPSSTCPPDSTETETPAPPDVAETETTAPPSTTSTLEFS
jgi:hypothetical protein